MSGPADDEGQARIRRLVTAGILDPEYPRYHEVFAGLTDEEEAILIAIKQRCDEADQSEYRELFPWRLPH
jgi:hypothetical protein